MTFLIATVGTTAKLLEESIKHHHPDWVVFIASQQTHQTLQSLSEWLEGRQHKTLLVNDAEDWDECYKVSLEALNFIVGLKEVNHTPRIIADLTGGTKIMSIGLALALASRGVTWSYVGATKREEVTGRAVSGHENVKAFADPRLSIVSQKLTDLKHAWDSWHFEEAETISVSLCDMPVVTSQQVVFTQFTGVLKGFAHWDRFQYQEAYTLLQAHLPHASDAAAQWGEPTWAQLLYDLQDQSLPMLRTLAQQPQPSLKLVQDLLANAQRRASTERYDDALVRYLRALDVATTRVLGRGVERGGDSSLADLERQFARDYRDGKLRSLIEEQKGSLLISGLGAIGREDYETVENYVLGLYEPLGLHPAPGWPKFV
jgi:CRISPR-associated protein (TIGR02710 family)